MTTQPGTERTTNRGSLTTTRRRILQAIHDAEGTEYFPPTLRELCEKTGISSTSTIHRHLRALEDLGWIRRDPATRSIVVLHPDEDPAYLSETERRTIQATIRRVLDTDLDHAVRPSDRQPVAVALSHSLSPVVARFLDRPAPNGATQ